MHDDPQLNLAKVKQQISDWRINKISNSNKIPEEIKTAITNLIPQHSSSTICKTFGISGSQYKSLQKNQSIKNKYKNSKKIKQQFKKIILPTSCNMYHATIENKNGCRLILQIPSIADLNALIGNFIGGNKNVSVF